jgi:hypothetical protein
LRNATKNFWCHAEIRIADYYLITAYLP